MIDKNIGVNLEESYFIKKLDQDYFEEPINNTIQLKFLHHSTEPED